MKRLFSIFALVLFTLSVRADESQSGPATPPPVTADDCDEDNGGGWDADVTYSTRSGSANKKGYQGRVPYRMIPTVDYHYFLQDTVKIHENLSWTDPVDPMVNPTATASGTSKYDATFKIHRVTGVETVTCSDEWTISGNAVTPGSTSRNTTDPETAKGRFWSGHDALTATVWDERDEWVFMNNAATNTLTETLSLLTGPIVPTSAPSGSQSSGHFEHRWEYSDEYETKDAAAAAGAQAASSAWSNASPSPASAHNTTASGGQSVTVGDLKMFLRLATRPNWNNVYLLNLAYATEGKPVRIETIEIPVVGTGGEIVIEKEILGATLPENTIVYIESAGWAGETRAGNVELRGPDCIPCRMLGKRAVPGSSAPRLGDGPELYLPLGVMGNAASAGYLKYSVSEAGPQMYSLDSLQKIVFPTNTVVLTNGSAIQVQTPQTWVNLTNIPHGFMVSFFLPSDATSQVNGWNSSSAEPFVKWVFENPDASATITNRLKISEIRGSHTVVNMYTWIAASNRWEFLGGNGLTKEVLRYPQVGFSGVVKVREVLNPSNNAVLESTTLGYTNTWGGQRLASMQQGTNAPTTFEYSNGQITLEKYPSGGWTRYGYTNGRKTQEINGWLDNDSNNSASSANYTLHHSYGLDYGSINTITTRPGAPRKTSYTLLGNEIGTTYRFRNAYDRTIRRANETGVEYNETQYFSERRETDYQTSDFRNAMRKTTDDFDGTRTVYFYSTNATGLTTVTLHGEPATSATNILSGTKTTEILGLFGEHIETTVRDFTSDIILSKKTSSNFDAFRRPAKITYLDGTFEGFGYACCGLETYTNRLGVVTTYTYDDLKRVTSTTVNGVASINSLNAAGHLLSLTRQGTNGPSSNIVVEESKYELDGRVVQRINALGGTNLFGYGYNVAGQTARTNTLPSGGVVIETFAKNGMLLKVEGSGAFPRNYEYGTEMPTLTLGETYYRKETNPENANEWTKTYSDLWGRDFRIVQSAAGAGQSESITTLVWNEKGQLEKEIDPDGVATVFKYNGRGELSHAGIDVDGGGLTFGGIDRIVSIDTVVTQAHGTDVRQTTASRWQTDTDPASTPLARIAVSTDGLRAWNTVFTNSVNGVPSGVVAEVIATVPNNGIFTVKSKAPDGSFRLREYKNGNLLKDSHNPSSGASVWKTTYGYDEHDRVKTATDDRNGATSFTYNNADEVSSVTTPAPGTGQAAQLTLFYNDRSGYVTNIVFADNTQVNNRYSARGELTNNVGSRTYPSEFTYDAQGRIKTLKTWKTYPNTGAAETTWVYDNQGREFTKTYPGTSKGTEYTYTPGGRLRTRQWVRYLPSTTTRLLTTYGYGFDDNSGTKEHGDLVSISYNDNTPATTISYDRAGRRTQIASADLTTSFTYLWGNILQRQNHTAGALAGLAVRSHLDSYGRRAQVQAEPSTGTPFAGTLNRYGYDTAGRIQTVGDGTDVATYSYHANSPLVGQISFARNGTEKLGVTKRHDRLNRLSGITSTPSNKAHLAFDFGYTYSDANQRVRANVGDGSYWIYEYDKLGQVTSAKRYWNDGTPVAGQQHTYSFDEIGNRTASSSGGDETGATSSLRSISYASNPLNQLTAATGGKYAEVLGGAANVSGAAVTVNSSAAYRRGEYFRKEVGPSSTSPLLQSVSVTATLGANSETKTGSLLLAPSNQTFGYDDDGNMTSDSVWSYKWDAENRLIETKSLPSAANAAIPSGAQVWVTYKYDAAGRRIEKSVRTWNSTGSTWNAATSECFVYDGWNVIGTFNSTTKAYKQGYVWGLDLSGSVKGAGGVGGLLQVRDTSNVAHFVAYDGMGNVVGLVDTDGNVTARYEYDAFGKTLRASGAMAKLNPFRFSTKWVDDETGLYYYGYRYYSAELGRWINRDPLAERGGLNINGFAFNSPVNLVDTDGRQVAGVVIAETLGTASSGGAGLTMTINLGGGAAPVAASVASTVLAPLAAVASSLSLASYMDAQFQEIHGLQADAAYLDSQAAKLDQRLKEAKRGHYLKEGERVDQEGNVLDENGKIIRDKFGNEIKCAADSDSRGKQPGPGQFYDSRGRLRNADGTFAETGQPKSPDYDTEKVRRLWEEANGQKWPHDPRTGRPFDAHHIVRRTDGGALYDPSNIVPVHPDKHKRIHHPSSGLYPDL